MAAVKGLSCATLCYGDPFPSAHSVICALISGKTANARTRAMAVTQSCLFNIALFFFKLITT